MSDRYSCVIENIKVYGNRNSIYKPFDRAVCYALTSQDFVRTGFLKIAPTLSARDYKDPKIVIEEQKQMIEIKQATEKDYIEMEEGGVFDASFPGSETRRGRVQEGGTVSPTITAQNNELYRIENPILIGGEQKHQSVKKDGICTTLCSAMGTGGGYVPLVMKYRIRKLTPYECFLLMGVTPENARKMLAVNSNSQCYKQAGNSIVVDVMAAMFKKLF